MANDSAIRLQQQSVTVVVVAICSLQNIERTLSALQGQRNAPSFDIVVAVDPRLGSLEKLKATFPDVRFLSRESCRTPIELAALGLKAARGERILLTEDSCLPDPRWVSSLALSPSAGRGAVGGVIEPGNSASAAMWAFYYVDFFRYMSPSASGETPTLSVCNVAYRRSDLNAIYDLWKDGFLETDVHNALREKFGPLEICADAVVQVRRNVRFGDAVYERYAFGRLFGSARVAHATTGRRAYFSVFAPALPVLLMGRMTAKAARNPQARAKFVKSLPSLVAMIAAWSWGEWLGYVTSRRPARITTAPEIDLPLNR
jgi:hypothetical protein